MQNQNITQQQQQPLNQSQQQQMQQPQQFLQANISQVQGQQVQKSQVALTQQQQYQQQLQIQQARLQLEQQLALKKRSLPADVQRIEELFNLLKKPTLIGRPVVAKQTIRCLFEYLQLDQMNKTLYNYLNESLTKYGPKLQKEEFMELFLKMETKKNTGNLDQLSLLFTVLDRNKNGSFSYQEFADLYKEQTGFSKLQGGGSSDEDRKRAKQILDDLKKIEENFELISSNMEITPVQFYDILSLPYKPPGRNYEVDPGDPKRFNLWLQTEPPNQAYQNNILELQRQQQIQASQMFNLNSVVGGQQNQVLKSQVGFQNQQYGQGQLGGLNQQFVGQNQYGQSQYGGQKAYN